jgi:hypothetical protein
MLRFIAIYLLTIAISLPLLIMGGVWASKAYLRHKQEEGTLNITPSSIPPLRQGTTTVSAPSTQPTISAEPAREKPKLYPAKPRFIRKAPKRKRVPCVWGANGKCYPIDTTSNWRGTGVMRPDGTYPQPGDQPRPGAWE